MVHTLLMETERKVNVRIWSRSPKLMVFAMSLPLFCFCLFIFQMTLRYFDIVWLMWWNLSLVDLTLPSVHLSHEPGLSLEWVTLKIGTWNYLTFCKISSSGIMALAMNGSPPWLLQCSSQYWRPSWPSTSNLLKPTWTPTRCSSSLSLLNFNLRSGYGPEQNDHNADQNHHNRQDLYHDHDHHFN